MFGKDVEFNEQIWAFLEDFGNHMPGGFFIYKEEKPEELLYANQVCCEIYGCKNLEEFKELTGFTFEGMLYHEDYRSIYDSIVEQISIGDDHMDHVEYRIVRKDGAIRWVDDYGHYTETEAYGGVYFVFIYDITEKREKHEKVNLVRDAVVETLTNTYNTVWLISDIDREICTLFHSDNDSIHAEAIKNALSHSRYTDTMQEYVETMVAAEDRERMYKELSIAHIKRQLSERERFSVTFIRRFESGPRYYRIDFGKVRMPGGRIGVIMGFLDVDIDTRKEHAYLQAIQKVKQEQERRRQELDSMITALASDYRSVYHVNLDRDDAAVPVPA